MTTLFSQLSMSNANSYLYCQLLGVVYEAK